MDNDRLAGNALIAIGVGMAMRTFYTLYLDWKDRRASEERCEYWRRQAEKAMNDLRANESEFNECLNTLKNSNKET